jgi:hypothetical protein
MYCSICNAYCQWKRAILYRGLSNGCILLSFENATQTTGEIGRLGKKKWEEKRKREVWERAGWEYKVREVERESERDGRERVGKIKMVSRERLWRKKGAREQVWEGQREKESWSRSEDHYTETNE